MLPDIYLKTKNYLILIESKFLGALVSTLIVLCNVEAMSKPGNNPEINRMLGSEGKLGEQLGLGKDWAKNVIASVGNYGEIFERHIGKKTAIGLARGLNQQWTKGGLQYSPPFR